MAKYIVSDTMPIMVTYYYEIEADNEDDVISVYCDTQGGGPIGYSLGDTLDFADSLDLVYEPADSEPWALQAARVEAVASELLESLVEALDVMGDWGEDGDPAWAERARAVIAKAKGTA